MITVEVTEHDIESGIANLRYSPLEIATSRSLNVEIERLEIKYDGVFVWLYDDSDYIQYKYLDEESQFDVHDFINEWEAFIQDESIEEFLASPFSFNLEDKHDPRTESRHWAATSFDYSEFTDDPDDGFRKKSRNRLTDDDDWV